MIKLLNLVYIFFYDTESFIIVVLTPTPILSFFKQGVARRKNPARRPRPGDGGFFSLLLELNLLGVAT